MIEIGGKPILWHIMKIYSSYGFNEFIICLGYKGYVIKEYFANYFLHQSNVTIDLENNNIKILQSKAEPWKITLVDTGFTTMTGGRSGDMRRPCYSVLANTKAKALGIALPHWRDGLAAYLRKKYDNLPKPLRQEP